MSTLKVNTLQDASGGNSSTAEQIAQGRAKQWLNFDGYNNSIRDSFGVSSVTDEGTGQYRINFSTAYANTNYSWSGTASTATSTRNTGRVVCQFATNQTTSNNLLKTDSCSVKSMQISNAINDTDFLYFQAYGD